LDQRRKGRVGGPAEKERKRDGGITSIEICTRGGGETSAFKVIEGKKEGGGLIWRGKNFVQKNVKDTAVWFV